MAIEAQTPEATAAISVAPAPTPPGAREGSSFPCEGRGEIHLFHVLQLLGEGSGVGADIKSTWGHYQYLASLCLSFLSFLPLFLPPSPPPVLRCPVCPVLAVGSSAALTGFMESLQVVCLWVWRSSPWPQARGVGNSPELQVLLLRVL